MNPIWRAVFALHLLLAGGASALERDAAQLEPLPAAMTGDWLTQEVRGRAGVWRGSDDRRVELANGLVRRSFLAGEGFGTVALDHRVSGESLVRAARPEAVLVVNGRELKVGGFEGPQVGNYLDDRGIGRLRAPAEGMRFEGFEWRALRERMAWKPNKEWLAGHIPQPASGVELVAHFVIPSGAGEMAGLGVRVHHELHDQLPLFCKWLTISNGTAKPVTLDSLVSESLACVEATSEVEELVRPRLPNLHVETDFTTVAMSGEAAQRQTVHWLADTNYGSQVNYLLKTPCLLEVRPPLGPARVLQPGEVFTSFRTWTLVLDDRDEARRTLSLGRMYRTLAPWSMENPLIFHARSAKPDAVKLAIDQAAEAGFELVILTFGSGFNIEDDRPESLERMRELVTYAHSKGVGLGGYSLLASRSVGPEHDVVNPATGRPGGFAQFGESPCLASKWGEAYFGKLRRFIEATGMDVLEHDGSYPGDACASTNHPGHAGYADSRWRQWEIITDFYQWCRARGVYLNVPDWYFLNGSSKTGMGYRETNWSLPRDQQEIIERQNIADGTRFKTPTMGWMFVPLTEYHGGGAAATIEPLHEHRDHYGRRLANLLGAGVQACFRGPRLFDTPETLAVVRQWVGFYKERRAILDSDLLVLRRADGRDWDGWMHVNARLDVPALAVIYNPLEVAAERTIRVPLRLAGLAGTASCRSSDGTEREVTLDRGEVAAMRMTLPPKGQEWLEFRPLRNR